MGAAPHAGIVSLMVGVVSWLFGFDVLYALQDKGFDREHRLHSVPARFGTTRALAVSAAAHVVTVVAFAATGVLLGRGWPFALAVALCAALLLYEHLLVGKGDLSRMDKAFFDVNAYVSVAFFALTALDALWR
jgi:4-hydroxybenzoate polyprenyltransferase